MSLIRVNIKLLGKFFFSKIIIRTFDDFSITLHSPYYNIYLVLLFPDPFSTAFNSSLQNTYKHILEQLYANIVCKEYILETQLKFLENFFNHFPGETSTLQKQTMICSLSKLSISQSQVTTGRL